MPALCKRIITKKNKKRKAIGYGFHDPIGAFRRKAGYRYDSEYDQAMGKAVELRDRYEDMELVPKDKETIDSLLDALDEVEVTQVNLSYLAGLADCLLILDEGARNSVSMEI